MKEPLFCLFRLDIYLAEAAALVYYRQNFTYFFRKTVNCALLRPVLQFSKQVGVAKGLSTCLFMAVSQPYPLGQNKSQRRFLY